MYEKINFGSENTVPLPQTKPKISSSSPIPISPQAFQKVSPPSPREILSQKPDFSPKSLEWGKMDHNFLIRLVQISKIYFQRNIRSTSTSKSTKIFVVSHKLTVSDFGVRCFMSHRCLNKHISSIYLSRMLNPNNQLTFGRNVSNGRNVFAKQTN